MERATRLLAAIRPVWRSARAHRLPTHAAAIAFRVLIALVPLALLGIAMLGVLGLEDVWRDSIGPPLLDRLEAPVYTAIDFTVTEIFASPKLGLIAFATLLLVWELVRAVHAVSAALNEIHGTEESRTWWRVLLVTFGLALAVGACVIGSVLVTIVGGRIGLLASILRWPVAVLLLAVAVALLLRYAPAEQPKIRWVSAGSGAIVAGWVLLSLGFGIWVRDIASYKSATGSLAVFLVLTTYILAVSAVFLVGVEIDEYVRGDTAKKTSR